MLVTTVHDPLEGGLGASNITSLGKPFSHFVRHTGCCLPRTFQAAVDGSLISGQSTYNIPPRGKPVSQFDRRVGCHLARHIGIAAIDGPLISGSGTLIEEL
jgi:hypothetical protein